LKKYCLIILAVLAQEEISCYKLQIILFSELLGLKTSSIFSLLRRQLLNRLVLALLLVQQETVSMETSAFRWARTNVWSVVNN
jgi:hypothetical protein